jgi:hypothetical protein
MLLMSSFLCSVCETCPAFCDEYMATLVKIHSSVFECFIYTDDAILVSTVWECKYENGH